MAIREPAAWAEPWPRGMVASRRRRATLREGFVPAPPPSAVIDELAAAVAAPAGEEALVTFDAEGSAMDSSDRAGERPRTLEDRAGRQ